MREWIYLIQVACYVTRYTVSYLVQSEYSGYKDTYPAIATRSLRSFGSLVMVSFESGGHAQQAKGALPTRYIS